MWRSFLQLPFSLLSAAPKPKTLRQQFFPHSEAAIEGQQLLLHSETAVEGQQLLLH